MHVIAAGGFCQWLRYTSGYVLCATRVCHYEFITFWKIRHHTFAMRLRLVLTHGCRHTGTFHGSVITRSREKGFLRGIHYLVESSSTRKVKHRYVQNLMG